MVQGQGANSDNFRILFSIFYAITMLNAFIRIASISWKKKNISLNICFLSYRKNFVWTQKLVRISHVKRAIGVRIIEVSLYLSRNVGKRTIRHERQTI